jgi:hypothetical protein
LWEEHRVARAYSHECSTNLSVGSISNLLPEYWQAKTATHCENQSRGDLYPSLNLLPLPLDLGLQCVNLVANPGFECVNLVIQTLLLFQHHIFNVLVEDCELRIGDGLCRSSSRSCSGEDELVALSGLFQEGWLTKSRLRPDYTPLVNWRKACDERTSDSEP